MIHKDVEKAITHTHTHTHTYTHSNQARYFSFPSRREDLSVVFVNLYHSSVSKMSEGWRARGQRSCRFIQSTTSNPERFQLHLKHAFLYLLFIYFGYQYIFSMMNVFAFMSLTLRVTVMCRMYFNVSVMGKLVVQVNKN